MLTIKYLYNSNLNVMRNIKDDCLLCVLLTKISSSIQIKMKHLEFIYDGKTLQKTDKKKMSEFKKKNILILVIKTKKENINKMSHIICPECKECSLLNIEDNNNITIEKCSKNHKNIFHNLTDFFKSQDIKDKLLDNNNKLFICDNHGKEYISFCKTCYKNLCCLCEKYHI